MQDTPADRLLPAVVERMRAGTDLRELVAAAALANARAFGGQDYDGYHAFMALAPAYHMSQELPEDRRALPVLKVLYRNTSHIQQSGGCDHETLHPIDADSSPGNRPSAEALREPGPHGRTWPAPSGPSPPWRAGRSTRPTTTSSTSSRTTPNVHRVVLAWRSWALLDLTGKEHAHTLLRQSVRFCVDEEANVRKYKPADALRPLLPKLLDQYKLVDRAAGDRRPDDAWIDRMARRSTASDRSKAADAVAAALAEGIAPEAVGEAISLAANQLVLHDPGRKKDEPGKPKGSVHGASVGVHASDAANAWRNIARVSNRRNAVASLIVGAYHTAGQTGGLNPQPYPLAEHRETVRDVAPGACSPRPKTAIKANDQARACALVHRYGELGRRGAAGVRPAARLRDQRGRRPARREVLPDRHRGVRLDPPGLPLAAPGRPGPRDRQRARASRAGRRRLRRLLGGDLRRVRLRTVPTDRTQTVRSDPTKTTLPSGRAVRRSQDRSWTQSPLPNPASPRCGSEAIPSGAESWRAATCGPRRTEPPCGCAGCGRGAGRGGAGARRGRRPAAVAARLDRRLELAVEVVVARDVARELGALELVGVRGEHGALDLLPAHRVDRVGDVGVQLGAAVGVADGAVLVEAAAALVAEPAPQVVLGAAVPAAVGQLPRRHGHEEALGPLDDLQVADDEHVVERDAAERLQPLVAARVVFHELDADFGDLHGRTPLRCVLRIVHGSRTAGDDPDPS